MEKNEQRLFFNEFKKYPRDGALHELLEDAVVVQVLNNRAERRMKAILRFGSYVDKAGRRAVEQAICEAYALTEARVIACFHTDDISPYIGELMEELQAEFPVLSGYCDGSAEFADGRLKVRTGFSGGAILQSMQCDRRIAAYIEMKFGVQASVCFEDAPESSVDYEEYERRMREKLASERPSSQAAPLQAAPSQAASRSGSSRTQGDRRPLLRQRPAARTLYGREIKSDPVDIANVDVLMGRATVCGVLDEIHTVKIKNGEGIMLLFRLEDRTSGIGVKVFPGEKTSLLLSSLHNGDRVIVRGAVEDDRYAGDVAIRASSIGKLPSGKYADTAAEKRVELRAHTHYSVGGGMISPQALVDRAADWGHSAVAVTDRMSVQALPFAYKRAKERGIKLICGADVNYINDSQLAVFGADDADFQHRFIVFDIETTGLSASVDRITEIGAVVVENGTVKESFQTFVDPGMRIPSQIVALTGITNDMVAGAPNEAQAVTAFLEFAGDVPLVAHNANFDCGFIRVAARRSNIAFDNTYIDTVPICRSLFPELKSVKLDIVASHLGVGRFNHHRADEDARVLAEIFIALLERLEKDRQIHAISEINPQISASALGRPDRITVLVRNEEGLMNLYSLLSEAGRTGGRVPAITQSMLMCSRGGLLIGSGNMDGELIKMMVEGRSDSDIRRAAKFYDYFELPPLSCAMRRVDTGWIRDVRQLQMLYEQMFDLAARQEKPIVASGDVCCLSEDALLQWDVLCTARNQRSGRDPLYFRTTDEMLDEFAFLGDYRAVDLVIDNPARIAEMCEDVAPLPPLRADGEDEAFRALREAVLVSAGEYYGEPYPAQVRVRLEQELTAIHGAGMSAALRVACAAVNGLENAAGAGWTGLSLCAFLLGLSDYDPLPDVPAAEKANVDFSADGYASGGFKYRVPPFSAGGQKGVDVPFSWFEYALSHASAAVTLRAPGDAGGALYSVAAEQTGGEGEGRVLYGSRPDPLPQSTARAYVRRYEEERNTVLRESASARIIEALTECYRSVEIDRGTVAVDFGRTPTLRRLPVQTLRESGERCSHMTNEGLCEAYVRLSLSGDPALTALSLMERETGIRCGEIGFDDGAVYEYLRAASAEGGESRPIPLLADRSRLTADAPPDSFEAFVRLFECDGDDGIPARIDALERARTAFRLLWFMLHRADVFFGALFSAYVRDIDFDLFTNAAALERAIKAGAEEGAASVKTPDVLCRFALEMRRRGIDFLPVDLLASAPSELLQTEQGVRLPLCALSFLGEREIASIAAAKTEAGTDAEALVRRAGLSAAAVAKLREAGLIEDGGSTDQLTLF